MSELPQSRLGQVMHVLYLLCACRAPECRRKSRILSVPELIFIQCVKNKILYFKHEAGGCFYATSFLLSQLCLVPEGLPIPILRMLTLGVGSSGQVLPQTIISIDD